MLIAQDTVNGIIQDRHLRLPVTLDIKNVFNLVPRRRDDDAVKGIEVPKGYTVDTLRST